MMNRIFSCDQLFEVYTYFLIIVTAYVSRGLSTYFGTERTTHVVRRLEIVTSGRWDGKDSAHRLLFILIHVH